MVDTLSKAEFRARWDEVQGWEIQGGKSDILEHEDGPLWVIAGPGTGKTEALIIRTLKLLTVEGVPAESIMLTTFTEKGAEELQDRITNAVEDFGYGDDINVENLRAGTLHSLCDEIMREFRYPEYIDLELLDGEDQEFFIKRNVNAVDWVKSNPDVYEYFRPVMPRFSSEYGPNTWQATQIATQVLNKTRQYLVDPDELAEADEPVLRELADKLSRYQETLAEEYRTDFAQLQLHFLNFLDSEFGQSFVNGNEELDQPPLEYVLVDEYQDTNPLQEAIYFELAQACDTDITVVGDDDQAMYRFRGGSVECMVRFGKKCRTEFGAEPEPVQLTQNFRSHTDIVDWVNRYIGNHRNLPPSARAGDKEPLEPAAGIDDDYPAVSAILGGSRRGAADRMASFIKFLLNEGIIDDYSQIALLLRSTRESPQNAQDFVEALRDAGIPIYNPRNKALTEQEEVQLALGALVTLLDRYHTVREADYMKGRFLGTIDEWTERFDEFRKTDEGTELDNYTKQSHESLDRAGFEQELETVQDVFYRILSREPFSTWREEDPNCSVRLARLSNLIEAYSNVYSGNLRTSANIPGHFSHGWLRGFYYNFLQYVANSGFDEPEDPYDQIPEGFVQVMTVHQAKGLEFPVVFAGDINKRDGSGGTHFMESELAPYSGLSLDSTPDERADRDNVRRFFVQYSRAQDQLVLTGSKSSVKQIALGHDAAGHPATTEWFGRNGAEIESEEDFDRYNTIDREFEADDGPRRRYSVTGDILSYRRCARQYGHFTDFGFSPAGSGQLYFGQVVHRTLDRIHQQYKGQIEGKQAGVVPDEETVEEYFQEVSESLVSRGIYPMSEKAEEKALEYIQRFNRQMGGELYPAVKDTEHQLKRQHEDFVLQGTVDVLTRSAADDDDPSDWEIWDYKASQVPPEESHDMQNYRFQMQVYAGLFELKNGKLPSRAVLYFLGEDTPKDAMVEIPFTREMIDRAIEIFSNTVNEIEESRRRESWPAPKPEDAPTEETCADCDLRWDCPAVEGKYPLRTP